MQQAILQLLPTITWALIGLQVVITLIFHSYWLINIFKFSITLVIAYTLELIWIIFTLIMSIQSYTNNKNTFYINDYNLSLISTLAFVASMVLCLYYILAKRPIQVKDADGTNHSIYAFPIHLFVFIISTSVILVSHLIVSQLF